MSSQQAEAKAQLALALLQMNPSSGGGGPQQNYIQQQLLQRLLGLQPTVESLVNIGGSAVVTGSDTCVSSGVRQRAASRAEQGPPQAQAKSKITYAYKVKIINPAKKSSVTVRHLNDCSYKFESLLLKLFKIVCPGLLILV